MAARIWTSSTVSVIVLPSGREGEELLALARQWTAAWIMGPAFWVMAEQIPESVQHGADIKAYFLGRDATGHAAQQEVDLFWALGAEEFSLVRLIAVRCKQERLEQQLTTHKVGLIASYLDMARPGVAEITHSSHIGTEFVKVNLIFSETREKDSIPKSIVETAWDANILASPEDRPTPGSFDAFVQRDEHYYGFVLSHVASAGGLWTGLPKSTFEMTDTRPNRSQIRMQRVFVRAVASDKLSGDLAKWALDQASSPDNEKVLGRLSGKDVSALDTSLVPQKIRELVKYLLQGTGDENFLFQPWNDKIFREEAPLSLFDKLLIRIQDFVEAIKYMPRFMRHTINQSFDRDVHERESLSHLPKRLWLNFGPFTEEDVLYKDVPTVQPTSYQLWEHVRKTFSSSVDSPPNYPVPEPLNPQTRDRLVLGDMRNVAPDPNDSWDGSELSDIAGVQVSTVEWLDVQAHKEQKTFLEGKKEELAPVIALAEKELSETKELHRQSLEYEKNTVIELDRANDELVQDVDFAEEIRIEHTHGLPSRLAGPPRPPRVGDSTIDKVEDQQKLNLNATYENQVQVVENNQFDANDADERPTDSTIDVVDKSANDQANIESEGPTSIDTDVDTDNEDEITQLGDE